MMAGIIGCEHFRVFCATSNRFCQLQRPCPLQRAEAESAGTKSTGVSLPQARPLHWVVREQQRMNPKGGGRVGSGWAQRA
jgi:hypothetical protein